MFVLNQYDFHVNIVIIDRYHFFFRKIGILMKKNLYKICMILLNFAKKTDKSSKKTLIKKKTTNPMNDSMTNPTTNPTAKKTKNPAKKKAT